MTEQRERNNFAKWTDHNGNRIPTRNITELAAFRLQGVRDGLADFTGRRDKAQEALNVAQGHVDRLVEELAYWERVYEDITTFDEHQGQEILEAQA